MADEEEKQELSKKELKKLEKEEKKRAKEEKKKAKENGELNDEEDDEDAGGSGILVALVAVIIVIVWLAILALLIKMDVGGFGSTVLYPYLKDIPVINQILPESEEYAEVDEAYDFATMDEAVARIKELEQQIADNEANSSTDDARIAELEAEEKELQEYKQNEAEFEAEKEKFYQEVVFSDNAPDIEEYKAYYESIDSENAEKIYKEVVEQVQEDEELEDYVKAYSSMKPKQAAAIFDTMTDDLSLVAKILSQMDSEARGDILGAMDQDTAAQVTEIMEP